MNQPQPVLMTCPECGGFMLFTNTANVGFCPAQNCRIGFWNPILQTGMYKMPAPPSGVRWVSKGEGLLATSKTIAADAPLPDGWREGQS